MSLAYAGIPHVAGKEKKQTEKETKCETDETWAAVQRQTAVTAYLKSKQLLLFVFAPQNNEGHWAIVGRSAGDLWYLGFVFSARYREPTASAIQCYVCSLCA